MAQGELGPSSRRQGRPVLVFRSALDLICSLLPEGKTLWHKHYVDAKVRTAYVPKSLKLCAHLQQCLQDVDIEPCDEEDVADACCLRIINRAEDQSEDWREWAEKQYLCFIGGPMPVVYGAVFPGDWKTGNEDGFGIPKGSFAVVYAEGTVEALGGPLIKIRGGVKSEIPKYDSLKLLQLGPGAGPLRHVAKWIFEAKSDRKAMAFTGAGISQESGVPTYRDAGGLWKTFNAMEVSSIKGLVRDPRKVWKFEEMFFSLLRKVSYNPGHKALADLEKKKYLTGVVTQNVDSLHQSSGSENVVELHGSEVNAICLACKEKTSLVHVFDDIIAAQKDDEVNPDPDVIHPDPELNAKLKSQLEAHQLRCKKKSSSSSGSGSESDSSSCSSSSSSSSRSATLDSKEKKDPADAPRVAAVPTCPKCKGFLKPDGVYFGEPLSKKVLGKALKMAVYSEVLLVIGTSGKVNSARQLPLLAKKEPRPSKVVEVNPNNTMLSAHANIRLLAPSAIILPLLEQEIEFLEANEAMKERAEGGASSISLINDEETATTATIERETSKEVSISSVVEDTEKRDEGGEGDTGARGKMEVDDSNGLCPMEDEDSQKSGQQPPASCARELKRRDIGDENTMNEREGNDAKRSISLKNGHGHNTDTSCSMSMGHSGEKTYTGDDTHGLGHEKSSVSSVASKDNEETTSPTGLKKTHPARTQKQSMNGSINGTSGVAGSTPKKRRSSKSSVPSL